MFPGESKDNILPGAEAAIEEACSSQGLMFLAELIQLTKKQFRKASGLILLNVTFFLTFSDADNNSICILADWKQPAGMQWKLLGTNYNQYEFC